MKRQMLSKGFRRRQRILQDKILSGVKYHRNIALTPEKYHDKIILFFEVSSIILVIYETNFRYFQLQASSYEKQTGPVFLNASVSLD